MKKKNRIFIYPLVIMGVLLMLTSSCKKKDTNNDPVAQIPVLTTATVSNISQTTATCGGTISSDGGSTVTARGVCWSIGQTPTITDSKTTDGTGTGSFTSAITGLNANTIYYVRAYATNTAGTGYGSAMQFTTLQGIPVLTTSTVSNILQTTASCGGNITSQGISTVSARGVCWSTGQTPTIADSKTNDGTGIGSFTSAITGLTANTAYYVRAYATNSAGTGYGNEIAFGTEGTVTDIDGNIYHSVTIGTQVWLVENLKTTKYRNGSAIPNVTDNTAWSILTTGAYSDYNNTPSNSDTYGRLYNWYAATNVQNICPLGWHIPTDAEWTTLTTYLGGEPVAGGKLKETGTTHWLSPNTGATNESGFTALPGGNRSNSGVFSGIGGNGFWWSSTNFNTVFAWNLYMSYYNSTVVRSNYNMAYGFSVRCIKD